MKEHAALAAIFIQCDDCRQLLRLGVYMSGGSGNLTVILPTHSTSWLIGQLLTGMLSLVRRQNIQRIHDPFLTRHLTLHFHFQPCHVVLYPFTIMAVNQPGLYFKYNRLPSQVE